MVVGSRLRLGFCLWVGSGGRRWNAPSESVDAGPADANAGGARDPAARERGDAKWHARAVSKPHVHQHPRVARPRLERGLDRLERGAARRVALGVERAQRWQRAALEGGGERREPRVAHAVVVQPQVLERRELRRVRTWRRGSDSPSYV